MEQSTVIQVEELCFGYDSREVLHNVSFSLQEGDFAVVVGPNGGGKTTLLRLMLGFLTPVYGRISLWGQKPADARRLIGYVPQSLQTDPGFPITVEEVVLTGRVDRHSWGPYGREDRKQASLALEKVNLSSFGPRLFSELSGGERQRVLVARALASQPRLLMLDEPGASLDPENRRKLYELLHELNRNLTVLLVSHNLNVVASFASHVLCVNRTAEMHRADQVSTGTLEQGIWRHLTHQDCPVCNPERENEHSPHLGKPCDTCGHLHCHHHPANGTEGGKQ